VLDAQAMIDVDTIGAGVLRQAITLLKKRNITVAVSRADRSFCSWLEQYELMELIDPSRFYPTNRHAAQAYRQSLAGPTADPDARAFDATTLRMALAALAVLVFLGTLIALLGMPICHE
jgi:hypothetical protein